MAYNAQTAMCLSIFYPKIYTKQFFKVEFSPITLQNFNGTKALIIFDYFLFFIQLIFLLNEIQFLK